MFCNKCGHEFDGNFCPKCGAKAKNAPETPVNTTVNFSEEKDENPYNVYYNEQPQNAQFQNTYEPQFGYQPPTQESESVVNAQNTPPRQPVQPPYQQPYQPYHPPYSAPQPPKDKSLKWWQILLIVLAALLGFGLFSGIIPMVCVGCTIATCDEMYLNDYTSSTTIDEVCYMDETAVSEYFSYTLSGAVEIEEYATSKPRKGYKFIEVTIDIKNISNHAEWLSYETSCYVGDNLCHEIYADDYYYDYGDLHPGKSYQQIIVYEVPDDAEKIDIYFNDYYKNINFVIK